MPEIEQGTRKLFALSSQYTSSDGTQSVKYLEQGYNRKDGGNHSDDCLIVVEEMCPGSAEDHEHRTKARLSIRHKAITDMIRTSISWR